MKNKIYQFLWYYVVKPFVPLTKDPKKPYNHIKRFRAQLRLARLFGGAHGVLFGDSEAGQFDSYAVMSRFSRIVMNWGVGGTVAIEWYSLFMGRGDLRKAIVPLKRVMSIGGNYSLRGIMREAMDGMVKLHGLVRPSWILLVPPVYAKALGMMAKTEKQWRDEMEQIRAIQIALWKRFAIDTYSPFVDAHGDPKPGVLEDMVHFSRRCVEIIQRYIDPVL